MYIWDKWEQGWSLSTRRLCNISALLENIMQSEALHMHSTGHQRGHKGLHQSEVSSAHAAVCRQLLIYVSNQTLVIKLSGVVLPFICNANQFK